MLVVGDHDGVSGSTWFRWWLGEEDAAPRVWTVGSELDQALAELDDALPVRRSGESLLESVERALQGALTDYQRESRLMEKLGRLLIPEWLRDELEERALRRGPSVMKIVPAFNTVRVPWELLAVWSKLGPRLLHLASVVVDAPAAFHVGRAVMPRTTPISGPTVRIIDPALPEANSRLFTDSQRARLTKVGDPVSPGEAIDADGFGALLRAHPRPKGVLFVGHVASEDGSAGSTALRLSPAPARVRPKLPESAARGHLTARDLVLGTADTHRAVRQLGFEIWPMPPRVAFIACESGGDHGRMEPFGLLIAALNNGAEFALGTRWVLLADRAFRASSRLQSTDPQPLLELSRAAEKVVVAADPIEALRRFQIDAFDRWHLDAVEHQYRASAEPADITRSAISPLTWGALTLAAASPRSVESRAAQASGTE